MAIANTQVQLTDTTLLTVPAGKTFAITTLIVCNTATYDVSGSNDTSFDLHFVKSGQAKGAQNQICNNITVQGADTFTFDTEKVVIDAGDSIVIVSQAPANLSATVSYLEV
tara:strand:+ start:1304 stop:1636 length:333 start_codon:yes stop_codon:yes gene_type:complete